MVPAVSAAVLARAAILGPAGWAAIPGRMALREQTERRARMDRAGAMAPSASFNPAKAMDGDRQVDPAGPDVNLFSRIKLQLNALTQWRKYDAALRRRLVCIFEALTSQSRSTELLLRRSPGYPSSTATAFRFSGCCIFRPRNPGLVLCARPESRATIRSSGLHSRSSV